MNESDEQRDHIWQQLYEKIRALLGQHGKENAFGDGDFWMVDDNYGWRRHTVYLFNLKMLDPVTVDRLRAFLMDLPEWEIVLVIDVPGKEVEWPRMGLTIRKQEVIDGLSRSHLPEPYRSIAIAGSRPGTGDD